MGRGEARDHHGPYHREIPNGNAVLQPRTKLAGTTLSFVGTGVRRRKILHDQDVRVAVTVVSLCALVRNAGSGVSDDQFGGEFDMVGVDLLAVGEAERSAQGDGAHLA